MPLEVGNLIGQPAGDGRQVALVQLGQRLRNCFVALFAGETFDGQPEGRLVVAAGILALAQRHAHTRPEVAGIRVARIGILAGAQRQVDVVAQLPIAGGGLDFGREEHDRLFFAVPLPSFSS